MALRALTGVGFEAKTTLKLWCSIDCLEKNIHNVVKWK